MQKEYWAFLSDTGKVKLKKFKDYEEIEKYDDEHEGRRTDVFEANSEYEALLYAKEELT